MNPIKLICFRSDLAPHMEQFVIFKRAQGYDYTSQARNLRYFDDFLLDLDEDQQRSCLRLETLQQYVESTKTLKPLSQRGRLSSLREFTRYLQARFPESIVLPSDIIARQRQTVRFYRIEPQQVAELISATAVLLPPKSILQHSIRLLIGLLYTTGLRISEALALTLGDIDPKNSTLWVNNGKFGKQRFVPMSPSTLVALTAYLTIRHRHAATAKSAPLLIGAYDTELKYYQAYDWFSRLCRHCGLRDKPPPRLHDLRHNYACRCLELWRQQQKDVNAMLPVLATALGHVNIHATQIYLHIEPAQLRHAAARLDNHLDSNSESQS